MQGSGQDCRLYVQQLNSLKETDIFSRIPTQREVDFNENTFANDVSREHDARPAVSKWAKYLVPEGEGLVDAQDLPSRDTRATEDVMPNEGFPSDVVADNDFEDDLLNDDNCEIEDITDNCAAKTVRSIGCGHDSVSVDECRFRVNGNFNGGLSNVKTKSNVTNIFETNERLDEPLNL